MTKFGTLCLLAAVVGALIPFAYAQGGFTCPHMEPRTQSNTNFGEQVSCGTPTNPVPCPQNFSIDFNYPCDLASPNKCCRPGEVVVTKVVSYTCDSNDKCKKNTHEEKGMGNTKGDCGDTSCDEPDPPGGGGEGE